jgi:hypothetical protein
MKDLVITHGQDSILCVLSTTSCFAPRGYDLVEEIAIFCAKKGIGTVYGGKMILNAQLN